ncbi:MAG: ABC transporter substrate-binding protein [Actinomycetota bacterium]|nr:ABC transporter substrate-binding protein [Actinomycetota bacterium]
MRRLAPLLIAALALVGACSTPGAEVSPSTLHVFGPFRGDAADRFAASVAPFEDATGIDVRYVGSADLAGELRRRVNDGKSPDVALVPQPGVVRELRDLGALAELTDTTSEAVSASLLPQARELGEIDGALVGVPYRLSVKSLVWYPPAAFAEAGWDVPTTLEELNELTREISGEGLAPWCFGIEAFGATGWVVTDWIEDLVLRLAGPEAFDRWVAGDLGFSTPGISAAFDHAAQLLLERGNVLGNQLGVVQTQVDEAILPMLDDPPACLLHRNASFTEDWLPAGTTVGPEGDVDVFVLPGIDAGSEPPLLIGMNLAVPMTADEGAQQLLRYLATPDGGASWAAAGGYIGPFAAEPGYYTETDRRFADLIEGAEVLRVDGSDQMEPDFGTGAFWTIGAEWASGLVDTDTVLTQLDDARAATAR